MNEQHAWAHWWARPSTHSPTALAHVCPALQRSHHALAGAAQGIEPCLPAEPCAALLRLILATGQQREHMLLLVDCVLRKASLDQLDKEQQIWCLRLAKALPADPLLANVDHPLHYLRAWVTPAVWQRLRLLFAPQQVLALEQSPRLADAHGRLGTVWQAAIWRISSAYLPQRSDHDVMPTQN